MATFQIKKRTDGQFYFVLQGNNNEVILTSEGYLTRQGCTTGIESVKANAPYDSRYQRITSTGGSPYFNLTAMNDQVIGTSQMYSSVSARETGIAAVKTWAPCSGVVDLT